MTATGKRKMRQFRRKLCKTSAFPNYCVFFLFYLFVHDKIAHIKPDVTPHVVCVLISIS